MPNGVLKMIFIPVSKSIACIDTDRKVTYLSLETMQVTKQLEAAYDG